MIDYRLHWPNNVAWRWTRDLSGFAPLLAGGAVVEMAAAFRDGVYKWSSEATSGGMVEIVNPEAGKYLAIFTAPLPLRALAWPARARGSCNGLCALQSIRT